MAEPPVISLKNVSFAYQQTPVLTEVNLNIQERRFMSIVGPNAGGKSTLLKLILGLVHPQKGSIQVLGLPPKQSRIKMGYVPQYAYFDPHFPVTAKEVVLMGRLGLRCGGAYSKADHKIADGMIDKLNLSSAANDSFATLSGGQRQRILIARALCCEPQILLLDEPTANVDSKTEASIYAMLHELNKTITILMISHDVSFVSKFVDQVVCVNRHVVTHTTQEITNESLQKIFAGDFLRVQHDTHCHPEHSHAEPGHPEDCCHD